MKKSTVKRKLVHLLKKWENSRLDSKCAEEILSLLTSKEIGMFPPDWSEESKSAEFDDWQLHAEEIFGIFTWEPEAVFKNKKEKL